MQYAHDVRLADRGENLQGDLGCLLRPERAIVTHDIAERTIREPVRGGLEHHPGQPVVLGNVEDPDDVRMIELGKRTSLVEQALVPGFLLLLVGGWRPGDRPEHHLPMPQSVVGEPDGSHVVPADDIPQPVPGGDDAARFSAPHTLRVPDPSSS